MCCTPHRVTNSVGETTDVLEVMTYFRKSEAVKLEYEKVLLFVELFPHMMLSMVLMQSVLCLWNPEAAFCPLRVGINCCVYVQIEIV